MMMRVERGGEHRGRGRVISHTWGSGSECSSAIMLAWDCLDGSLMPYKNDITIVMIMCCYARTEIGKNTGKDVKFPSQCDGAAKWNSAISLLICLHTCDCH